MGAKLVSGRVEKISSANVSADRYQFLSLSEAEPDLGLPLSDGQVLASNTSGGRYFVTLNTDNVTEANSLYYTNARVQSHLDSAGYQTAANILANVQAYTDLSGNTTTDLAEGDNLYYTNARVGSYLAQNDISVQSLVVQGNLTVQGTTTTLNTDVLTIEDKNIVLANGAINASVADGAGITIDGAQANIVYRESGDKFEINKNLEVTGNVISNGLIVDFITANTWNRLSTSNVIEDVSYLYYTNARVFSNVSNMSINVFADVYMENPEVNDILIWDGNGFVLTAIEQATAANIANVVLSLQLNNTDELSEGNVNLYFSNTLARGAFTAGKNITISPTGIINASDTTESFNLNIDGSEEYRLTDTMSEAINFNSLSSTNKVVMKSIHFTNITDELAYFSGNIVFGDGNTVIIANRIPVPEGTSIELLERTFVFSANDKVNLQGFDSAGNPTANIIDSILSYDIIEGDTSYKSIGFDMTDNNAKLVINSESVYSIVESIRIVNIDTDISKANVYITDANDNVRAYLAHNLSIPPNTSVEVLHSPKRINTNNKLYVKKNSPNISVVCSYRISEVVTILSQTSQVTSGSNLSISLSTTVPDGTQIYYSIQ